MNWLEMEIVTMACFAGVHRWKSDINIFRYYWQGSSLFYYWDRGRFGRVNYWERHFFFMASVGLVICKQGAIDHFAPGWRLVSHHQSPFPPVFTVVQEILHVKIKRLQKTNFRPSLRKALKQTKTCAARNLHWSMSQKLSMLLKIELIGTRSFVVSSF